MENRVQLSYLNLKAGTAESHLGLNIKQRDDGKFFAEFDIKNDAWLFIRTILADALEDNILPLEAANFLEAETAFRQLAADRDLKASPATYWYTKAGPSGTPFIFSIETLRSHADLALKGWNFPFEPQEASFRQFIDTIYSDKVCQRVGVYSGVIVLTLSDEAKSDQNRLQTYLHIISLYEPA